MTKNILILSVLISLSSLLSAQEGRPTWVSTSVSEIGYTGSSDIGEGLTARGDIDTFSTRVGYTVMNIRNPKYQWFVGTEWQRIGLGITPGTPLPNTLNAFTLKLGNSWKFSDKWTFQGSIKPGLYSDLEDISGGDFNAPLTMRFIYAKSETFQWVFGLAANL